MASQEVGHSTWFRSCIPIISVKLFVCGVRCQMRVFGTGVLGTRYCRVPGSWYRAEGCVGPDR